VIFLGLFCVVLLVFSYPLVKNKMVFTKRPRGKLRGKEGDREFITGAIFTWKERSDLTRRKKRLLEGSRAVLQGHSWWGGSGRTGCVCAGLGKKDRGTVMVSRRRLGSCLMSLNYRRKVFGLLVCDPESQLATLEAPYTLLQENRGKMF